MDVNESGIDWFIPDQDVESQGLLSIMMSCSNKCYASEILQFALSSKY